MSQAGFKTGVGRFSVFEDSEATALTTQPPNFQTPTLVYTIQATTELGLSKVVKIRGGVEC